MHLCVRKFHPKRLLGMITWLAVIVLIFHQLSIITISVQVHPPQFAKPRDLDVEYKNETEIETATDEGTLYKEENVRLVRGHLRKTKGYLTVGFCTVPRKGAFYLPQTLESLMANLTTFQQQTTVIVIYLGSYDDAWVKDVLALIDGSYKKGVESGMIQVVRPDPQIYPDFSKLTRRTYGDSTDRIIWRTKQNIDYAYLFSHSREISKYYIHIEDDVKAVPGYLNKIKSFVDMRKKADDQWFCLEFTRQGFIGKLFRSSDLPRMKDYFLMFQFEKPGDLLLNDLKATMTQFRDIYNVQSIFKHIGRQSSLTNKTHVIRESSFKGSYKNNYRPFGRTFNPPAKIQTSMVPYLKYNPEDAYSMTSHKIFWAESVKQGDTFEVVLQDNARLKGATVSTGHPIKKTNRLLGGVVKYGLSVTDDGSCKVHRTLGTLKDGYFHYSAFLSIEIKCLVLYVTKHQSSHVIISKIVLAC